MLKRVEHALKLDQAPNAEERRQLITLYSIGIPLTVANVAIFMAAGAMGWQNTRVIEGVSLLICLGMLLAIWLGYVAWANRLYPTMMLAILVVVAFAGDGVFDEAMLAFPALIALAGLLLRRTGVIVFTVASIVAVTILGVAHQMLWIQKYADTFTFTRVIIVDILLAMGGVIIYYVIDNLVSNIARLRQNELSLAANNQELQAIRATLEVQVAERTARAESARQDAEEARRMIELQMWQAVGQAKLSETLRGEQTLEALSRNIVGFLCRYLELPVGVLFVRDGNALQFRGGFAYALDSSAVTCFDLGEGLVGQVAVEKRILVLDSLPANQLSIPSSVGNIIPQALVLLPLCYNDEVVGVLELGAMLAFLEEQITFLDQASESIAIALYTAQTRLRFAQLFEETQRQAEELQVQEEELRAVNEELLAHIESTRHLEKEQ